MASASSAIGNGSVPFTRSVAKRLKQERDAKTAVVSTQFFDNLPLVKHMVTLLDTPSLCYFASTNKRNYRAYHPVPLIMTPIKPTVSALSLGEILGIGDALHEHRFPFPAEFIPSRCNRLAHLDYTKTIHTMDTAYDVTDADILALPESIETLKICSNELKNPDFRRLTKLRKLDLSECLNIERINIAGLSLLEEVNLSKCTKLLNICFEEGCAPDDEVTVAKLRILDLSFCVSFPSIDLEGLLELVSLNLTGTLGLKTAHLHDLPRLTSLGTLVTGMTHVDISDVPELREISFSNCTSLASLVLKGIPKLENIVLTKTRLAGKEADFLKMATAK